MHYERFLLKSGLLFRDVHNSTHFHSNFIRILLYWTQISEKSPKIVYPRSWSLVLGLTQGPRPRFPPKKDPRPKDQDQGPRSWYDTTLHVSSCLWDTPYKGYTYAYNVCVVDVLPLVEFTIDASIGA